MEIDWLQHAVIFLNAHGWEKITKKENQWAEGLWQHPLFPLLEEMEAYQPKSEITFCKEFYNKSWEAYCGVISGSLIIIEAEEEKNKEAENES